MDLKFYENLDDNYKTGFLTLYLYGCEIETLVKSFTKQKEKLISMHPDAYNFKFEYCHNEGQPQISFIVPKNKSEIDSDKVRKDYILQIKIQQAIQLLKENGITIKDI